MNIYTAWTLKNIAVVIVVGFAVWVSGDPWEMLGLCFLSSFSTKSDDDEKEKQDESKTTPKV